MIIYSYPYHESDFELYKYIVKRYKEEYGNYFHCRLYSIVTDKPYKLDYPMYNNINMAVFFGNIFNQYLKWRIINT